MAKENRGKEEIQSDLSSSNEKTPLLMGNSNNNNNYNNYNVIDSIVISEPAPTDKIEDSIKLFLTAEDLKSLNQWLEKKTQANQPHLFADFLLYSNNMQLTRLSRPSPAEWAAFLSSLALSFYTCWSYLQGAKAGANYLPPGPAEFFGAFGNLNVDEYLAQPVSFILNFILNAYFFDPVLKKFFIAAYHSYFANHPNLPGELKQLFHMQPQLRQNFLIKIFKNILQTMLAMSCAFTFAALAYFYSPFSSLSAIIPYSAANGFMFLPMMYLGAVFGKKLLGYPYQAFEYALSCRSNRATRNYNVDKGIDILKNAYVNLLQSKKQLIRKMIGNKWYMYAPLLELFEHFRKNERAVDTFQLLLQIMNLRDRCADQIVRYKNQKWVANAIAKIILCLYFVYMQLTSLIGYFLLQKKIMIQLLLALITVTMISNAISSPVGQWTTGIITFITFLLVSIKSSCDVGLNTLSGIQQFTLGLYSYLTGQNKEPFFLVNPALQHNLHYLLATPPFILTAWQSSATGIGLTINLIKEIYGNEAAEMVRNFGPGIFNVIWSATAGTATFNLVGLLNFIVTLPRIIERFKANKPDVKDETQIKVEIRLDDFIENESDLIKDMPNKEFIHLMKNIKTRCDKFKLDFFHELSKDEKVKKYMAGFSENFPEQGEDITVGDMVHTLHKLANPKTKKRENEKGFWQSCLSCCANFGKKAVKNDITEKSFFSNNGFQSDDDASSSGSMSEQEKQDLMDQQGIEILSGSHA